MRGEGEHGKRKRQGKRDEGGKISVFILCPSPLTFHPF
jgi:hypothetical protein